MELARELGRLPRLVVYGIEGESFEAGEGLSDPVEKTVEKLVLDLYQRAQRGELMHELAVAQAIVAASERRPVSVVRVRGGRLRRLVREPIVPAKHTGK